MARVRNISRDQIVEAAKTVLQHRGPEALTIKAVAEQASVTQGTIYYYFKAKEDLVNAVIRSAVDEQIERFDAAFASTHDELMRIERTLDAVREAFLKDDDFHRRLFGLVAKGLADEGSAREMQLIMERLSATMDKHLRAAISDKTRLPVPVEHIGRILRATFDGLALQSLFDKEIDIDAVFDSLKVIILALYGHDRAE
ncbi:MAG: TetR/AcrR family transcriptional regulator [Actinomycetota bacterium]